METHFRDKRCTGLQYPVPPHLSESYVEKIWKAGDFPVTDYLTKTVLSIPIGPYIDKKAQRYVASAIKNALN